MTLTICSTAKGPTTVAPDPLYPSPTPEPAFKFLSLHETSDFLDRVAQTLDDLQAQVNAQRLLLVDHTLPLQPP